MQNRALKRCARCKEDLPTNHFFAINDIMFPDGYSSLCMSCIDELIKKNEDDEWQFVDRVCQWLGIPFIPQKWTQTKETFEEAPFEMYFKMYKDLTFDYVNWGEAYKYYKELDNANELHNKIDSISKAKITELRNKWGKEYTEQDQLLYLEKMYNNVLADYAVVGSTALDSIMKFCKVSLLLEEKIRAGDDIDKTIRALESIRKMAGLDPKNIKDAADFSSFAEVFLFLEQTGWLNTFYDNVNRDIVDKTMKDIQGWCRSLYVNESSIPEDISSRIEALKYADSMVDELNTIEDNGPEDMEGFDEEFDFDPFAGVE